MKFVLLSVFLGCKIHGREVPCFSSCPIPAPRRELGAEEEQVSSGPRELRGAAYLPAGSAPSPGTAEGHSPASSLWSSGD